MRLFIAGIAGILCMMNSCSTGNSKATADDSAVHGSDEGFGVDPGSRKYYEYMRQQDPATGRVPDHARERSLAFASRLPRRQDRQLDWEQRGPYNIGGRTRSFAIDVTNENVLLAGAVSGGLWRSENDGFTWTKTTTPDQLQTVGCIAQDTRPGHENTWYFGSGEEFYGVVSGTSFTSILSGDGIFKSDDGGMSWYQLESTASGTPQDVLQNGSYDFVWRVVPDPTHLEEDVVYAAVYNGIIRSSDGGDSWEEVLGFWPSAADFTDLIMTPSGVLYAAFSFVNGAYPGGIYRSENGTDWTLISTNDQFYSQRRIAMAYNPQDEDELFFIAEMNNSVNTVGHVLYKYTYLGGDGSGGNGQWEDRSANLPDEECELQLSTLVEFAKFKSQNSYDLGIAHHPDEDVLMIGGTNVYRSLTSFAEDDQSWIGGYRCNVVFPNAYVYPNHHPDQHGMVFSPSEFDKMYSYNDGGVFVTEDVFADSVQWTSLNNGYVTTQFYTVGMEQGNTDSDIVFGGMQDNGTWLTSSASPTLPWTEMHNGDGSYCAMPEGHPFAVTSTQLGRMYKKLVDSDGNILNTQRIDPAGGPSALFVNPFLLDPYTGNDIFMAGNKTIWWLPDVNAIPVNGEYNEALDNDYWVNISESIIPTLAGSISCLDKPLANNNIIYYGTTNGYAFRLDDCFADEPVKTNITGENFPTGAYTSCIQVNTLVPDEVLLSFSNYNIPSIFHTTDGGTTWEDVSGNLEENADGTGAGPGVYWVEIYPSDPVIYFAGTSTGLYSTTLLDGANTTWEMEGASTIGNVVINMIDTRLYDGKILVGTHGNGIYSSSLSPVVGVRDVLPPVYWDVATYPNPFNSELHFQFQSNRPGMVHLEIFDITGQKVYDNRKQMDVSRQEMVWKPGKAAGSGTYFYLITSNGDTKSGKVMFSK